MSEQSAFPLFKRAGIAIHADRNRFVSSFVIGVSSARLNHIYMEPLSFQPIQFNRVINGKQKNQLLWARPIQESFA